MEKELCCRRGGRATAGKPLPFVLTGAQATYAPDRVCHVEHIRVQVKLDFEKARVEGVCTQTLVPFNGGVVRLELNAVEMEIGSVKLAQGGPVDFTYDGRVLRVLLGERSEGDKLDLEVRYSCVPRRGLYFIRPDEHYPNRPVQVWSQGQDEDNRHWFPCFDHPHDKSTSEVIATVPDRMAVLSNGKLVSDKVEGGLRTTHYKQEVPHSSYLITLVAGEYEMEKEKSGEVELRTYVAPGRKGDTARSFGRTAEMMRKFSEWTGQPYPYPSYSQITVAEFIFGGMENTSATTLTEDTLHDERAHLDFSSEPLVSHELAHQWFGDLLTCRDWSEGWLNEGFATYFEILWKEHADGQDEADYYRLLDMESYLDEDSHRYRRAIVTKVYHEPIDVFDSHLYEKGGCVLHMLRQQLGNERFWKAIRHYVQKHARKNVETRDLVRAVEDATGVNADRFFAQWVFGPGHPDLEITFGWDDDAKQARLDVKQKQAPETPAFHVPARMRFVVDGKVYDQPLTLAEAEETFLIPLPAKPAQAVFDPGNHFLKTLDFKKPDDIWQNELKGAEHAIDRLRAARALGKGGDPANTAALAQAAGGDEFWAVRGEAASALASIKSDAARDALLKCLASEKHPKARRLMARALGAFRHDSVAAQALAKHFSAGDASYFVEAETALALGKTRAKDGFEALRRGLEKSSYLEVIRSHTLIGLGELRDARSIDIALAWTERGRPVYARRAAAQALGTLGTFHAMRKVEIRERLCELLDDKDFRLRIMAVEALRTLGDPEAIGPLRRAELRDLDGRVRRRAREVQKSLSEGRPDADAIASLRESVERLDEENRKLRERVLKLEGK